MNLLSKIHRFISPVYSEILSVTELSDSYLSEMFKVMQVYYEDLNREKFVLDLKKKNKVILLKSSVTNRIVGFSTLYVFDLLNNNGIKSKGVFSGDTIIEREYWGGSALQVAFGVYLCFLKFINPKTKVFWFLISKGYKTYLLMTNNFPTHFPRFDRETPIELNSVLDKVYSYLYPTSWSKDSGLILNLHGEYHLKSGVGAPSQNLVDQNKQVQYFIQKNPNWEKGDELACIAEMNFSVLSSYLLKRFKKQFRRSTESQAVKVDYVK